MECGYNIVMFTLDAHFDGKAIVPDKAVHLPFKSGTRLKVQVEAIESPPNGKPPAQPFKPLDIQIDGELSNAIALDPRFNIEES